MNTDYMTQEQISAFADGELHDRGAEMALVALRQPEGQAAWDVYHQIGDVLRSEEMAFALSANFAARMAKRLDAEPAIVAPRARQAQVGQLSAAEAALAAKRPIRRYAMTGAAAIAVAAIALIGAPQLMVASKDSTSVSNAAIMVASVGQASAHEGVSAQAGPNASSAVPATGSAYGAVVLRDPRIDEYLLAHQRFSPSLYSTAQYARSAAFATGSDK